MPCSVAVYTCILKKFGVLVKHFPDGSKLLFDYRINLYMHTCVYINIMYVNVCVCVYSPDVVLDDVNTLLQLNHITTH